MSKKTKIGEKRSNKPNPETEEEIPFWIPLPFLELLEIALRLRRCIRCGEASDAERRDILLGKSFSALCIEEFHKNGLHYPRLMGDISNGERDVEFLSVSL